MNNILLREKSLVIALTAINIYKTLIKQNEYVISKQFLRSATSIGANIEEATGAYSRKDYSHRLSVAYKEARESKYWLILVKYDGYITVDNYTNLHQRIDEICRILFVIRQKLDQD